MQIGLTAGNLYKKNVTKEFTDIDNYEWAKPAIGLLVKKGSVNGKSSGIFAPSDKVTREEFIKMFSVSPAEAIKKLGEEKFREMAGKLREMNRKSAAK